MRSGCSSLKSQSTGRVDGRKVGFISDASSWRGWGGGHLSEGWLSSHWQAVGQSFYGQKEGAPCRNSTVSSDVIFRSVIGGLTSVRPCLFDAQLIFSSGLPRGLSGKESACHAGDPGSISGSGRARQPTAVCVPEEFRGQRRLAGYSPWGGRVGHD